MSVKTTVKISTQDPISDLLTRIRNAQMARHEDVRVYSSKMKISIVKLLKDEGYVQDYQVDDNDGKPILNIKLSYYQGSPVISSIKRISRPGLRIYKGFQELPKVMGGLGIAIISTSKGLLTDRAARALKVGGEVICYVE